MYAALLHHCVWQDCEVKAVICKITTSNFYVRKDGDIFDDKPKFVVVFLTALQSSLCDFLLITFL